MKPTAPICVVIGSLEVGGTERHLCQVLPRLKGRGWQVDVVTLTHRGALAPLLENAGIPVHEVPGATRIRAWPRVMRRPMALTMAVPMLAHHIRRSPGTITHFFLPMAYLVGMGTALAVGRPGPLVMSRRSLNLYQKKYPLIAAVERRLHRRADMVLANSAAVATQLRDEEGARADRLRLIYNGIDIEPFASERGARRTAMRAALGLADDVFVMAKVANLIPYKGHIDLLDALALVGDRLPGSWRLLMIGRDQGTQGHLEAHAAALGVAAHICWLGERLDVPDLLLASDLGLLVSHEEGFSNVVLEGMAAGLPMVVTDVGGNAEAVVDGETGLVVPPNAPAALADAIATLAANPVLARKYGAAGRDRVKRCFSLEACIDSYERMYAALSAEGGC